MKMGEKDGHDRKEFIRPSRSTMCLPTLNPTCAYPLQRRTCTCGSRGGGIWGRWGTRDHRRIWNPTDIPHLPNTNKDSIRKPSFSQHEQAKDRTRGEKIDVRNKTGALTFQNGRARVVLGISPDVFVVIFTQHIIVPILALRSKFAIREIEHCAGWWSVWRDRIRVAYRPSK